MSAPEWIVGEVNVTTRIGRSTCIGLLRNGLGLDERMPIRGDPQWALTHNATGFQVCMLAGPLFAILPVATELADCADWASGHFHVNADLAAKVREIGSKYEGIYYRKADAMEGGVQ